MCLNCGCGMPDDEMGNKDNLTLTDLAKAAMASQMNGEDTLREVKKSLEQISAEMLDQKIGELEDKKD